MKKLLFFAIIASSLLIASAQTSHVAYVKPIDPDGIVLNEQA